MVGAVGVVTLFGPLDLGVGHVESLGEVHERLVGEGTSTRKDDKPKPPALTPCDIFGPHVDTYLKSVQLYLYNLEAFDRY
eukprot:5486538-Pyramimonas_sp.AAC.1